MHILRGLIHLWRGLSKWIFVKKYLNSANPKRLFHTHPYFSQLVYIKCYMSVMGRQRKFSRNYWVSVHVAIADAHSMTMSFLFRLEAVFKAVTFSFTKCVCYVWLTYIRFTNLNIY